MKRVFLLFALLGISLLQAQNNNSLLWEISGNGLSKKSYVYGSMHVSDKISYHLSDSFFRHLLAADIVSNESDPETWSDVGVLLKKDKKENDYKFYSEFYLFPAKRENIQQAFVNRNNYFTSMLSGGNEEQADYQENTILDMFIYQTGRKYKKKIVGLEDAKQSMLTVLKIGEEDSRPTDKNIQLLIKIMKGKSFNDALNTYYREKDVVMIDSIYRLSVSKRAHDLLITGRNYIMTKSIDSLAKQGSLFAAVGAAHLGGKKGIIQLLRDKGYTVMPVIDVLTEKGQQQKKTIEEFFPDPNFSISGTTDEMIRMPLFKNHVDDDNNIGSPDFTNGGVIHIKRIPLNYFLKQQPRYDPKALDSLFFENIAGNIIDKKYFEQENYSGYDITSITKIGNTQHSRYYITPLELIAVAMTGTGNYVRKYENSVFDNIKIKPFKNNWNKIEPIKGGFTVDAPAFSSIYGNTPGKAENIQLQAYDNTDKSYYFLTEKTLNEVGELENTSYEHRQIHYEFYLQHDMDSTATKYDRIKNTFESMSDKKNKKIRLKTIIKGNKYYLLGTVDASEKNTERFFTSFTIVPFNYSSQNRKLTDTLAHFEIEIPEKPNERQFLQPENRKPGIKNTFTQRNYHYTFNSESGRQIYLEYHKYPKYESIASMDSIRSEFRKRFLQQDDDASVYEDEGTDYEISVAAPPAVDFAASPIDTASDYSTLQLSQWDKIMNLRNDNYRIVSESSSYDKENKIQIINTTVSKPNSSQAIRYKLLFKEDSYYILSTLVEKDYSGNDSFIETAFNTLHPTGKSEGSVFEDKVATFINDAKSEKDTIRYSALKSIYRLKLNSNDFDAITNFLNTFDFKSTEAESINLLLAKTGEIKDNRVIPFLENYYKREYTTSGIQISVLRAMASQKSKAAYTKIMEMLEYDLPVSDNGDEISSLFEDFEGDTANSKELFPKIFEYYSIKEYNYPVIHFCNLLADKKLINLKKINAFKKMIITNARLEYKRNLSRKESNEQIVPDNATGIVDEYDNEDYDDEDGSNTDLINYTKLLYHLPNDKTITQLIQKIKALDSPGLNIELAKLDILNNSISDAEIQRSLDNPKYQFSILQLLLSQNRKSFTSNMPDDAIARSAIIGLTNIKPKDTLTQLEKRVVLNNTKEVTYYFFENLNKSEQSELNKKQLYVIAFINDNKRINPLAYKIFQQRNIEENEDLNTLYQTIINESLNEEHSRSNFEKEKPVYRNHFYFD